MQRDLRGQREAASGDLSERAARKDTGHGITFFRICTFAYRVREFEEHGITSNRSCTFNYHVPENGAMLRFPT